MTAWFLKTIGVTDEVLAHLDKAELAFQHPGILWVGLVLLVPVSYFIIRRQRENLSTVPYRLRIALSVTRIFILLMLIGVLSGPYLKLDHRVEQKPIIAVVFDRSQSMQLPAGPFESEDELVALAKAAGYEAPKDKLDPETRKALNRIGRSDLAASVVRASADTVIAPLAKDYDLRYYSFARETKPLVFDPKKPEPAGAPGGMNSSSHLGSTVLAVLEEAAGRNIAGLVLFSDGQNTGGTSPAEAARKAAAAGVPIFTVPLGSRERIRDVSVVDVYTSGLVAVGETVRVAVTLESQGFDSRPSKVELRDGETVLDTKELVLKSTEQQQVELTFEAKEPGARYLTVAVPPLAEEAEELRANNADTAFVRISDEKLRVLLIDGLPRWDFRFLKNALRRDQGLAGRTGDAIDVVLEAEWTRLPDEAKAAALPRSLDELAKYHTVILGDVSPLLIDSDFRTLLAEAVREKGVGLIVAAGPVSMPHRFDTSFQELLPVKLRERAAGMEAPVYNPFRLELSPEGVIHETMRLYDDPGRNQNVWGRMPAYFWAAAAVRPAPAAAVLAWNPSVEGRYGKMPLIAYHYAGAGKVMFVGTDSTWLWRQNVGDRFFDRFWGQSLRFVARRDESAAGTKSWIEVRPVRAQPGEQAEIELMAFQPDGTPVTEKQLTASLLEPGWTKSLELTADKSKPGRYTGSFTPKEAGEHRIKYQPAGAAAEVEARLRVLVAPEEYRYPNLNRPTLELLAGTTGGEVVPLSALASIPPQLKGKTTQTELHREASLWDNWLMLLTLIVVYSADVGLRRLMGLS